LSRESFTPALNLRSGITSQNTTWSRGRFAKQSHQKHRRVPTSVRSMGTIDFVLLGKHTLQLFDPALRKDPRILAQTKEGFEQLDEYRACIRHAGTTICDCTSGFESGRHILHGCTTGTKRDCECDRQRATFQAVPPSYGGTRGALTR